MLTCSLHSYSSLRPHPSSLLSGGTDFLARSSENCYKRNFKSEISNLRLDILNLAPASSAFSTVFGGELSFSSDSRMCSPLAHLNESHKISS